MTDEELVAEQEAITTELDSISDRVKAYRKYKEIAKEAEKRAEDLRSEIASYLEDRGAEYGTVRGQLAIRWRGITSRRFDTKKFRKDNPDMAEMYTIESTTNRLEVIENAE